MKRKRCQHCKRKLLVNNKNFCNNKQSPDGFNDQCKKCCNKYGKRHRSKYKIEELKRHKIYSIRNRNKISFYHKKRRYEFKKLAINILGGKCSCPGCGEIRIGFLTIDHINGGGRKHREITNYRRDGLYIWIINNPKKAKKTLRVMCYNCNCGRNANGGSGICPHENNGKTNIEIELEQNNISEVTNV